MNTKLVLKLLAATSSIVLMEPRVLALEHYYLTDLGPLGSTSARARAINNRGMVLFQDSSGTLLFDGTQKYNLSTLVGSENQFVGYDLNLDGEIVGQAYFPELKTWHAAALLKSPGDRFGTRLSRLPDRNGTNSVGVSVNDDHNFVGYSTDASGNRVAYFSTVLAGPDDSTGLLPQGFLPERIRLINVVVGGIMWQDPVTQNSFIHAALYVLNGPDVVDFGTVNGEQNSLALDVSGGGPIAVGRSDTGLGGFDSGHAFRWDPNSRLVDLDVIPHPERVGPTEARGVNRRGEIVGNVDPIYQHAVIFKDGIVINLNFAFPKGIFIHGIQGWTLQTADAINDLGQLAGWGNKGIADVRAYLLTPVRPFVQREGTMIAVSWPALLEGFALESSADLSRSDSWQPVPNTPTMEGTLKVVRISPTEGQEFLRLAGQAE